ncbi:MAG: hypothetical protein HY060_12770 [Proteobacteria bacterium]|nr:hypothetical protein [Pseudomonadota bacterium]
MPGELPPQKSYRVTIAADGLPQEVYEIRGFVPGDAEREATSRYAANHRIGLFDGPRLNISVEEVGA